MSSYRKVCQVIPPLTVNFETGELELQFPDYECGDHDIDRVSVFLKDVRCFEPYIATQRFRVTIEEMDDPDADE